MRWRGPLSTRRAGRRSLHRRHKRRPPNTSTTLFPGTALALARQRESLEGLEPRLRSLLTRGRTGRSQGGLIAEQATEQARADRLRRPLSLTGAAFKSVSGFDDGWVLRDPQRFDGPIGVFSAIRDRDANHGSSSKNRYGSISPVRCRDELAQANYVEVVRSQRECRLRNITARTRRLPRGISAPLR